MQSTEAPSYALSFAAGTVVTTETSNTLADGMATRVPVPEALAIIRKGASRIVQVTRRRGRRSRCAPTGPIRIISPKAPAPPRSPPRCRRRQNSRGKRVGLILTGGNIDFDLFRNWIGTDAAPSPSGDGVTRMHI